MPDCQHCGGAVTRPDSFCAHCGARLEAATGEPTHDEADSRDRTPSVRPPRERQPESPGSAEAARQQRSADGPPPRRGPHGLPVPDGLKLACGLLAVLGASSAIGGLTALRARQALSAVGPAGTGVPVGGPVGGAGGGLALTGLLLVALGGAYLAAGYGLWRATGWAWTVTLATTGLGTALHLVGPTGGGMAAFSALGSGGLCAYLLLEGDRFRPSVRRARAASRAGGAADPRESAEGF